MPKYNKINIEIKTKANGKKEYTPWVSNGVKEQELGVVSTHDLKKGFILDSITGKRKIESFDSKELAIKVISKLIEDKNIEIENEEGEKIISFETETIDI